jgi:hypothetical protein
MKLKLLLSTIILSMSLVSFAQTDLVNMLMSDMNVTQGQAEGGAGALLNMAGETMNKTDYSALGDVIPDMSGLLGAVPSLGGKSMMGSMASKLTGMPAVVGAFDKLGLKESHIAIMTPLLVDYVEKKGGQAISKVFAKSIEG